MAPFLFWPLLLLICGFALWKGRSDERIAGLVCLAAALSTRLIVAPLDQRYQSVEISLLILDLFVLTAFVWIALRSSRFWPLWIAGLQLTNSMAHLLKAADTDLMPSAYAAAAAFWSYPILIVLAVGTWRTHRRSLSQRRVRANPA